MNNQFTQPNKIVAEQVNKQSIARTYNIKVNEVIYSTDTQSTLDNKKVIYDKPNQYVWGLPQSIPTGAKIVSLVDDTLTYIDGTKQTRVHLTFPGQITEVLGAKTGYAEIGAFESIEDLRSYTSLVNLEDGARVLVKSYYPNLEGGGGFFRWNAGSTKPDDKGFIIAPSSSPSKGRWEREFNSVYLNRTVSPLEFGAKLNDSTFDSAPAINAAILYLNPYSDRSYDSVTGGDVIMPAGKYYINDTIYASPNVRLIGTGGVPGFRSTRDGSASIYAMASMDLTKVMYDTAPWLNDGTARYKKTDEMLYGRTESDGYYGAYIENICFVGQVDTQAAIRIWRVPRSQIHNVAVYNCKVAFWLNGSWEVTIRNCYNYGAKYACFLLYQCTAINVYAGYFTSHTGFSWANATKQWFHRDTGVPANKPNIAFTTTGVYAYNSFDVNFHGGTFEGNNRDFALYYCQNVNFFGGYTEHLNPAASEKGHRVFIQAVASVANFFGTYMNHADKDLVVMSGNTIDSADNGFAKSERSMVNIVNPKVEYGFDNILKDLGYGTANIRIESPYPVTRDLSTTLSSQRNYTAEFVGLKDQYTMRIPAFVQATDSFSTTVNAIVNQGEYDVRLLMTNVGATKQQDLRFRILVGSTCSITNVESRSRYGTTTLVKPKSASFDASSGVLTLVFSGDNSDDYSLNRLKVTPVKGEERFIY